MFWEKQDGFDISLNVDNNINIIIASRFLHAWTQQSCTFSASESRSYSTWSLAHVKGSQKYRADYLYKLSLFRLNRVQECES